MMVAAKEIDPVAGILHNEPMSRHTSWRVGGPAELFFKPASVADLQAFLRTQPADRPIHWVGYGSNLLVRDGGLRGAVIATGALPRDIVRMADGRVQAGAGASCARLARHCAAWGLGPADFFAGIPGTLGGALAMNAGAFGGETWDCVSALDMIDRKGVLRRRMRAEFEVAYRSVGGIDGQWFLGAEFRFQADAAADRENIRQLLARRSATQPLGSPSCGSVFRNPPGRFAAELIEAAGLKGHRAGGAVVSAKHANFILNAGGATAADIEGLIAHVEACVLAHSGIELVREVRIIGEPLGEAADARA